jgi:nucleoside-diphosphate-sugar epimerase
MRVAVVGGTRFIGAAVVENLAAGGHEVLVVHRDEHEPGRGDDLLAEVAHLHANRRELGAGPGRPGRLRAGGA